MSGKGIRVAWFCPECGKPIVARGRLFNKNDYLCAGIDGTGRGGHVGPWRERIKRSKK